MAVHHFAISVVQTAGSDCETIRGLFLEYAESLGFSLDFQGFDEELAALPGCYAPPDGCLLLGMTGNDAAGCVGVRRLDPGRCEMKRLYVRPQYRDSGLGRALAEAAITAGRCNGYRIMVLDTVPGSMTAACALYRSLGFADGPTYYDNSAIGSQCMQLAL